MTIEIKNLESYSRSTSRSTGEFVTPPAPIYMDRWGGTGEFPPVSFEIVTEQVSGLQDKVSLTVDVLNAAGNKMSVSFEHPAPAKVTNFEGEKTRFRLSFCPDDILEAVSEVVYDHRCLLAFVTDLRSAEKVLGLS